MIEDMSLDPCDVWVYSQDSGHITWPKLSYIDFIDQSTTLDTNIVNESSPGLSRFFFQDARDEVLTHDGSMGRLHIYQHEWLIFMVNVGKYTVRPMDPILWVK